MLRTTYEHRRRMEQQPRQELRRQQFDRLSGLLAQVVAHNRFYGEKLAAVPLPLSSLDDLPKLPYTFKDELVTAPAAGEFAANLTYPLPKYVRYHRTSGTRGRPMAVLDTAEDWQWWIETWQYVLDAADVGPEDTVVMAFSFGPFIGFWSASDASAARGAMVVPTGGMSTLARVEMIRATQATVVCCTPSYALRMAEVASENQINTAGLRVRKIIVAGEPGGSLPHVRRRIEEAWGATVLDHAGASEIGPWGYGDSQQRGLHIIESEFIAEFLSVATGGPAEEGELAELVLTPLGRIGSPVLRYRTGDLVRPVFQHGQVNQFVVLEGGVLGRADDMFIVRGVNIFPSSIDQIVRGFPEIVEYRAVVTRLASTDALTVEIEDRLNAPDRVGRELRLRLGLKVEVCCVPLGTLPRFEGKGKRFVDRRGEPGDWQV